MQRSRNAVINWLSRVTTPRCDHKKRACERASERASHEPDPAASAAILDQAILTSALRETARRFLRLSFARGGGGVIYRPYFPSQARGTEHRTNPSSLFTVRLFARYYIRYITAISVLQKLDTLLARLVAVRELCFKPSCSVNQDYRYLVLSYIGKNSDQMIMHRDRGKN